MINKTTLQILIDARALIESPENWTRNCYGCDANGYPNGATKTTTVKRCAVGAVLAAGGDFDFIDKGFLGFDEDFNDSHSHAEVIAGFDKAIKAERAKVTS